ncbi:hypothetical protein KIMH_14100 [Bombiscardovia apis]|uniref:Leucine rich repeat variant domain-containing protein n=1 Tax=Bombiscardovia apis TaxID=2932182 RepID=A0ABN6SHQ3_9BIFI|nr:hypothetical protein [Bombiscardovia apis]BDR55299.1 hypothetical protein KIMH_14100 [Bombiscardovia apis]
MKLFSSMKRGRRAVKKVDKLKQLREGTQAGANPSQRPAQRSSSAGNTGNAGNPSSAAPPVPPLLLTPALACDPGTPPEVLWHIAREVPELRRWLPANPKASPEMLETISQLGGPGVKQALTILLESLGGSSR